MGKVSASRCWKKEERTYSCAGGGKPAAKIEQRLARHWGVREGERGEQLAPLVTGQKGAP